MGLTFFTIPLLPFPHGLGVGGTRPAGASHAPNLSKFASSNLPHGRRKLCPKKIFSPIHSLKPSKNPEKPEFSLEMSFFLQRGGSVGGCKRRVNEHAWWLPSPL
jgi:hypothetical protein